MGAVVHFRRGLVCRCVGGHSPAPLGQDYHWARGQPYQLRGHRAGEEGTYARAARGPDHDQARVLACRHGLQGVRGGSVVLDKPGGSVPRAFERARQRRRGRHEGVAESSGAD
jgi:hypothetical protein